MDSLTALSVASSTLQIVDFGAKILREAHEIYYSKDGTTAAHTELKKQVQHLRNLCEAQTQTDASTTSSLQEQRLEQLCRESNRIADELLGFLEDVTSRKANSILGSLSASLKGRSGRGKISSLRRKLDEHKTLISMQLLTVLNDPNSSIIRAIETLTSASHSDMSSLHAKLDSIRSDISSADLDGLCCTVSTQQLQKSIEDLFASMRRADMVNQVLSSLDFEDMEFRHDAVAEAHSRTFSWILEEDRPNEMPEVGFLNWLRSDSGIYWISGKPGSGKSTLMKYLCDQERTTKALEQWASPGRIVIGNHFFWNIGSEMQKSQEGLLRTLLFQIFHQCPELICKMVPIRDKAGHNALGCRRTWARADLIHSVMALKSQERIYSTEAVRLCFFIDGLDEYEGAHQEICEVLKNMADCGHIKLCISSRPWLVFRTAFGKDISRTICLQDLTRRDIELFVKDKLEADERYVALRQQEHIHVDLAEKVTKKAQGVFLWVSLAVNELLDSLHNCDTVEDLLKRLRGVPPTLTGYYRHMIDNIHPFYRKKASQTFLLLLERPMIFMDYPLLIFSILDDEPHDYADNEVNAFPFQEADLESAASNLRTRLHGRCKDLIEIDQLSVCQVADFLRIEVRFFHRTIVDFLQCRNIHGTLRSDSGPSFDPTSTLLRGYLMFLRRLPGDDGNPEEPGTRYAFFGIIERVLCIAQAIEQRSSKVESTLLMELDRIASRWYQDDHPWTEMFWLHGACERTPGQDFLAILAGYGIKSFIRRQIEASPLLWEHLSTGRLLYHAATYPQHPYLVLYLLQKGASPNEEIQKKLDEPPQSIWQFPPVSYSRRSSDLFHIAELLIEGGAEPRPLLNSQALSFYPELEGSFPQEGMVTTAEALVEIFGDQDGDYLVKLFDREDSNLGRFEEMSSTSCKQ
ncbi:MAG: hypothetical protein Q9165_003717 [Trypethelium subeluteriae]